MKTLYLIGGAMGVGKTAAGRELKLLLDKSVFLDGDWCWDMHPFTVNDETKKMVLDNICFMLSSFIKCSAIENIIFCWVMHEQSIIDEISSRINVSGCKVISVSLTCSREALAERLRRDIDAGLRSGDIIKRSTERLPMYRALDTVKIDVSEITAAEAAEMIAELGRTEE